MYSLSNKSSLPAYCAASPYKFLNHGESSLTKTQFLSQSQKTLNESNENFKVVVRVRPPLPREIEGDEFISTVQVSPDHKKLAVYEYFNLDIVPKENLLEYIQNPNNFALHQFSFDHVYDQDSSQEEVYTNTARQAVLSVLEGFNATIMAYGQTGTGKTYTMEGFKYNNWDEQRGIIPRSIEEIFKFIENGSDSKTTFMVRCSYLQIYNENISDLLRTDRTNLHIREDKKKGVYVDNLSEWAVRTPNEIYSLMQKGAMSRATAATKMNDVSSRSHAIFIIIVEQMLDEQTNETNVQKSIQTKNTEDGRRIWEEENEDGYRQIKVGKLNLVDLAGSERVRVTGATGKRLEECKKINQSLSALGNVIAALTGAVKGHVPYRDSKITRILEDSLGGNCKTTFMAMVSAAVEAFGESLSTLKFSSRARNIQNLAVVNEDVDNKALLRKYEAELKRLRSELQEKNKVLVDKRRLMQLEEERRKAEEERVEVVRELEERSREFLEEREAKKQLEEKIQAMNSQLLVGGRKIEDLPQFRSALEHQQKLIRSEYDKKLQDLEKERQLIEEDRMQVDKYKQLLLKQRDIMIALTSRLNERDETIVQLQEELDAYDRIHRETEEALEIANKRVFQLENGNSNSLQFIPSSSNLNLANTASPGINPTVITGNNANLIPPSSCRGSIYGWESGRDVVNHEGCETYNITQNNLLTNEQKILQLSKMAENQRQEILRLKKVKGDENTDYIKRKEEMDKEMKELLQNKDNEIEELKKTISKNESTTPASSSSSSILKAYFATNMDIKHSVDSIIDTLSKPNDPQKLQNVAKDLLNLQGLVDESLNQIQKSNIQEKKPAQVPSGAFLNISNLIAGGGEGRGILNEKNIYRNGGRNENMTGRFGMEGKIKN